jgi:hypothetical protein
MMTTLRSPNELLKAAQDNMLEDREPSSFEDWVKIMNFMAHNVDKRVQPIALLLVRDIYDMPLTDQDVKDICAFHEKKN